MEAVDVTQLLEEATAGNAAALDRLLPLVYDELRTLAGRHLRKERPDHTLGATALVHEAYMRLVRVDRMAWQGRAHFFAMASRVMRRILVDHALARKAQKRGGGAPATGLDGVSAVVLTQVEDLLALDQALERLQERSERQCRVVECRFFGGMSMEETAEALGVSPATVKRDWAVARAFLNRELA
ncbi:MAG: sigma-70 family RNA polymerase sigma factor [Gemmatimonadota bacterium]|nr:sigma-70 family RNA polymerase sigma factor [Gemmatimonadota bacterium]